MPSEPTTRPATEPAAEPVRPVVFAIETSCDDTACAVVDGAGRVLASVVSRQLAAHRPYGGVVPEIASREHLRNWPPVSAEALERAGLSLAEVDAVAATRGPGLVGALLVGLSLGKALAYGLGKPFLAVHHLEGHLYSPFLAPPGAAGGASAAADPLPERFVGLVVSGGHSNLYAVDGGRVETLGQSRDDAMGEVFDKVGKRLGLPYPQGPHVDRIAEETVADEAGGDGGDGDGDGDGVVTAQRRSAPSASPPSPATTSPSPASRARRSTPSRRSSATASTPISRSCRSPPPPPPCRRRWAASSCASAPPRWRRRSAA